MAAKRFSNITIVRILASRSGTEDTVGDEEEKRKHRQAM